MGKDRVRRYVGNNHLASFARDAAGVASRISADSEVRVIPRTCGVSDKRVPNHGFTLLSVSKSGKERVVARYSQVCVENCAACNRDGDYQQHLLNGVREEINSAGARTLPLTEGVGLRVLR